MSRSSFLAPPTAGRRCEHGGRTAGRQRPAATRRRVWDVDRGEPDRLQQTAERDPRSEEHTSELQSLMRISYAVFCLKKKNKQTEFILSQSDDSHSYHMKARIHHMS